MALTVIDTAAGVRLVEQTRQLLEALREHDKLAPDEVDRIVAMLIGHVRAWRPQVLVQP